MIHTGEYVEVLKHWESSPYHHVPSWSIYNTVPYVWDNDNAAGFTGYLVRPRVWDE